MAKILVIEDDEVILENILETLEYENFEVQGASNGRLGLEMADQFLPDLILCDIMMPEVNGYEVLNTLKGSTKFGEIPFIFLTAKGSRDDLRYGMDLGADDYLTKPFRPQELFSLIRSRLGIQESRRQRSTQQLDELRASVTQSLPHEFRTPLVSILGYSTMLAEDFESFDAETAKDMLFAIVRAGGRLQRLTENYLLYAQVEIYNRDAGKQAAMRAQITTEADFLIRETALEVAVEADRQNDLNFQTSPCNLRISTEDLTKIVAEVMQNACKFSKPNTPLVVSLSQQGQFGELKITDQGRGMTPEQIQQVGAFLQFDRRIYEQQGLGLGLAIVQGLVTLYGGELSIQSAGGTSVTVRLPLSPP